MNLTIQLPISGLDEPAIVEAFRTLGLDRPGLERLRDAEPVRLNRGVTIRVVAEYGDQVLVIRPDEGLTCITAINDALDETRLPHDFVWHRGDGSETARCPIRVMATQGLRLAEFASP